MTYDVTTVNRFTISPEVSLFFSPSANFPLLICSEVSEVTEKMLHASQIYFGFLFLKVLKRIVELKKLAYCISLPLPALLDLPLPPFPLPPPVSLPPPIVNDRSLTLLLPFLSD